MISLEVWLYGPLARYAPVPGKGSYSQFVLSLSDGATVADLMRELGIPSDEKGITFVNGDLTDMPGLSADLDRVLHDGDRVGLLHKRSMWPFQYRFLAKTSPEFEEAVRRRDGPSAFHSPRARAPASERR